MIYSLVEALGFICVLCFAWFVWPPLVLLLAGLVLVWWANIRGASAVRRPSKKSE